MLRNGRPVAGWLPPSLTYRPDPSNANYAFLPMAVEFLRFSFVQSTPYPADVLNGQMIVSLVNTTINPVNPVVSGPLSGPNPVVTNTSQELWVQ